MKNLKKDSLSFMVKIRNSIINN